MAYNPAYPPAGNAGYPSAPSGPGGAPWPGAPPPSYPGGAPWPGMPPQTGAPSGVWNPPQAGQQGTGVPVYNPSLPYMGPLGQIYDGFMVKIQGTIPHNANRFHINMSCGPYLNEQGDVALHLNPRFEGTNQVVRNSFLSGRWEKEDRGGTGFPLHQGQPFECIILVTNTEFRIAMNGQHFCEFAHRTSKERVTHLVIEGSVQIQSITQEGRGGSGVAPPPSGPFPPPSGTNPAHWGQPQPPHWGRGAPGSNQPPSAPPPGGYVPAPGGHVPPPGGYVPPSGGYVPPPGGYVPPPGGHVPPPGGYVPPGQQPPIQNPSHFPVPYKTIISGGLHQGSLIHISGIPRQHNPDRFLVNLKVNDQANGDIAFHFNPRFKEKVVVRNSYERGWKKEERQQATFPFTPGAPFDMIILIEQHQIKVAVNNQHFIEFRHRIQLLSSINMLEVEGDLQLTNVRV